MSVTVKVYITYIPLRIGLSLVLMARNSGLSSAFSLQHSLRTVLTQSRQRSKAASGGLE